MAFLKKNQAALLDFSRVAEQFVPDFKKWYMV
jgi:hypothetical protein